MGGLPANGRVTLLVLPYDGTTNRRKARRIE